MSDLIDRQAAIEALKKDMASLDHIIKGMSANDVRLDAYVSQRNQVDYDIYAIEQLPPAEPKRIRGKWMHDGSKWKNRWICSNCGYKWFFDCIEGAYCPNCGAKMEVTE